MSRQKPFFQKLKKACLCLLALFMIQTTVLPEPAQAACTTGITWVNKVSEWAATVWSNIKETAMELKYQFELDSYMGALTSFYNAIITQFEFFGGKMLAALESRIFGVQIETMISTKTAQAIADKKKSDEILRARVRSALKVFPPKNEMLCKTVFAGALITTTYDYEREVSRMAAEAISNRYRCPTCDGMGPDYVGIEHKNFLSRGYANPLDGLPKKYMKDIKGDDTRNFMRADEQPIDGGQIFEMPYVVTRLYIDPKTKKTLSVRSIEARADDEDRKKRQEFWIAAWDHIFLAAGPVPTPQHGKGMKTPVGKIERAMFNHCLASQNALIKQCTDQMAHYTRPNCDQMPELCKEQEKFCLSVDQVIDLEPYAYCKQGLSPYEELEISHLLCTTPTYMVRQIMGGATTKDGSGTSDLCAQSWFAWRDYETRLDSNCANAKRGLQDLRSCWAQVDRAGKHADAGGETGAAIAEVGDLGVFLSRLSLDEAQRGDPIVSIDFDSEVLTAPYTAPSSFVEREGL